jgi:hypothetical protein
MANTTMFIACNYFHSGLFDDTQCVGIYRVIVRMIGEKLFADVSE